MTRITLVVAALLLTALGGNAAAAEIDSGHKSKHAQKVMVLLNSIGVNSSEVRDFVEKVDSEVDMQNGYLHLAQREIPGGGRIALRWRVSNKHEPDPRSSKRLELALTPPADSALSNFEMIARTDSFTVRYRLDF
jgi:hypothetical protein